MIHITLATPTESIFSGDAQKVTISTSTGEITVLVGHEQLMTTIEAGQIIIEEAEEENKDKNSSIKSENEKSKIIYSAYNGVVNVENLKGKTNVKILLESSEDVKVLDEKVLEESIKRAKEANIEKMDTFGIEINQELLRDLNRIKLARRYAK